MILPTKREKKYFYNDIVEFVDFNCFEKFKSLIQDIENEYRYLCGINRRTGAL